MTEAYKLIPGEAVYAAFAIIDGQKHFGMLSIGTNPTLGENPVTIEINIFDFSEDIYDKEITIGFIDKIRDQEKFNSLEELKQVLAQDKLQTELIISRK